MIKSAKELAIMAEGGKKLSRILKEVLEKVGPGISTLEIDSWTEERIIAAGGIPSFKSVPKYHWATCTGLNEEVVHSIPRKDKLIKEGDLLKIDLGMCYQGFHTDLSWTVLVSNIATEQHSNKDKSYLEKLKFLEAGKRALNEAIKVAKEGNRIGHISQKIEEIITGAGYRPVEVLTGHGIGQRLHEEPMIPGVLRRRLKDTPELVSGMTLAIEVIYCLGSSEVVMKKDGWTIVSKDGKIAGLFERTIAVSGYKPIVITP